MKANSKATAKKKLGVNFCKEKRERHWDARKRQESYFWKKWKFPHRIFLAEPEYLAMLWENVVGETMKTLTESYLQELIIKLKREK